MEITKYQLILARKHE